MKKNLVYAMMSAIALTGAIGFTACSSNDDVVEEVNPTYDGNSVRTDFAFSVTKANAGTRMTAANVQESTSQNFLGIKEMFLLPFSAVPGSAQTEAATTTNTESFYLGNLTTSDINASVIGRDGTTSSKVYSLTLPVHTNNFLFYGLANNSGSNFEKGSVTRKGLNIPTSAAPSAAVSISNISFGLDKIVASNSLGGDSAKIANYLTAIANTTDWAGTVTLAATDGTYKALSELYQKFISASAPRAGSAEGVTRTVLDLYRSAYAINNQSSVSNVKTIAYNICRKIETGVDNVKVTIKASNAESATEVVIDGDNDPTTPPYISPTTAENWTASISGLADNTFPAGALHLPMGAAQLIWNTSDEEFDYNEAPLSFGPNSATMEIQKYRYPAELIYFDNSPLRATEQYRAIGDYPTSAANWDKEGEMTDNSGFNTTIWDKDEVTPGTRAVAMKNNVNYGVALLQTNVKLGEITSGNSGFTDNRKAVLGTGSDNDNQTDIDATQFKVTGILIGGQPKSVDWDMTNPDDDFDQVIYDNAIAFASTTLSSNYFNVDNYTTVFDNYASGNNQKNVRIALEIKNGDKDFYGCNGLIPAGNTFYLVGELDLTKVSTANPDNRYQRPTYHADYRLTKEDVQRVFMQDYKTIANITISEDALKDAYSTIPDLRSTEIVFGLSVDLKWEKGVTFEIEL